MRATIFHTPFETLVDNSSAPRHHRGMDPPFESLDFLYTPSADVKRDLAYFADVLGARVVFAIEGDDTRVAMLELSPAPPQLLLADHLEGERTILVYRVKNLRASLKAMAAKGWKREASFEIPQGPCCSFVAEGRHRIALYQLTRPEVAGHFEGRRDF
jgi:hypothetical protein